MLLIGSSVWAYVIGPLGPPSLAHEPRSVRAIVGAAVVPRRLCALRVRACTGSACGIISTLDLARIEYRQTLDELNYFVRDQQMPSDLKVKLRSYFRNTLHLMRARRYEQLLQKMSTRLRGDTAFRMSTRLFGQVPYLVHPDLEAEFMCNLAIKYAISVYSRLERIHCNNLFVIERGVVAK